MSSCLDLRFSSYFHFHKNYIVEVIKSQRERLGTKRGFIAVKPNCSIQAYVPELTPLRKYGIKEIVATTYQAISGAGKTFAEWPEMVDNLIPFIGGEALIFPLPESNVSFSILSLSSKLSRTL